MSKLSHKNFLLRNLTLKDLDLLYNWINDPFVRKNSLNNKPLDKKRHTKWFDNIINSKFDYIWIFTMNSLNLGVVRYEKENNNQYCFSYLLNKESRGKGFALDMIKMSLNKFSSIGSNSNKVILAKTKSDNKISIRSLTRAGFFLESENNNVITFKKLFENLQI